MDEMLVDVTAEVHNRMQQGFVSSQWAAHVHSNEVQTNTCWRLYPWPPGQPQIVASKTSHVRPTGKVNVTLRLLTNCLQVPQLGRNM